MDLAGAHRDDLRRPCVRWLRMSRAAAGVLKSTEALFSVIARLLERGRANLQ